MQCIFLAAWSCMFICAAIANDQVSSPAPKPGGFAHLKFDVKAKQVRVECEALEVNNPVEFFCCVKGSNDYESILRSEVKPSDLHTALLAVGLKPGEPLTYSEATNKWQPPHGPPLHIALEFEKDGKLTSVPAYRLMRDVKTKKPPPAFTWVFTGSRLMPDGRYSADVTGYLISVCNFDLTVIDVPLLVSSANETLEWERNPDLMPKAGSKVWMVIEPAGARNENEADPSPLPATRPADARGARIEADPPDATPDTQSATPPAATRLSDVHVDQQKVDTLKEYWHRKVAPHAGALREAAQAHYEAIGALRREQQRLIDEADRIQRTIDDLEKQYQDMTTPHPESTGS